MKDTEIEIQVQVENIANLLKFLEKEAKFQYDNRQIDEYFSPAHKDYLAVRPTAEWIRLRNSDGKFSVNYKNWHYTENGASNYCDEYETKVEDIEKMRKIFDALDFKKLTTVDKQRKTYLFENFEIAIDKVANLGDFVEIEYKGDDESVDPDVVADYMMSFLKGKNCGKISKNSVGYPFMLLFPDEVVIEKL